MEIIKFRYILRHIATGNIEVKFYYLNEIEKKSLALLSPAFGADYELISRDIFTGLTDHKGNQIYEGDILKSLIDRFGNILTFVVVFRHGAFCSRWTNENTASIRGGEVEPLPANLPMHYEVAGNIHQNKDLLPKSFSISI